MTSKRFNQLWPIFLAVCLAGLLGASPAVRAEEQTLGLSQPASGRVQLLTAAESAQAQSEETDESSSSSASAQPAAPLEPTNPSSSAQPQAPLEPTPSNSSAQVNSPLEPSPSDSARAASSISPSTSGRTNGNAAQSVSPRVSSGSGTSRSATRSTAASPLVPTEDKEKTETSSSSAKVSPIRKTNTNLPATGSASDLPLLTGGLLLLGVAALLPAILLARDAAD